MSDETLITLTADVVAAHVSNNVVSVSEIGELVRRVHEALQGLSSPEEKGPEPKVPVVSVRASVKPDYLICMECGKKQTMLKRHLNTAHGMTPEEYRRDYGLSADYPMSAPNYSKRRSDLAKEIGLGTKGNTGGRGRRKG